MRRFVLVWEMTKKAFTLIEVMVSVMIISVVIMALLKMNANNVHIFSQVKNQIKPNQYISLLDGTKYGFINEDITLDKLVSNFDLDDDLRRKLKNTKVNIVYQELQKIDTSEFDDSNATQDNSPEFTDEKKSSGTIYEIGKTILKTSKSSSALLRIRIK